MTPDRAVSQEEILTIGDYGLVDEEARSYIETTTDAVVSLVRSTYGPRGMDKLFALGNGADTTDEEVSDRREIVTSRGSQVFDIVDREIGFNDPIAAVFADNVDSMQRRLGDGTTTAVILAGKLVEIGCDLIDQGLRPTNVVLGYMMANARAGELLDELARPMHATDDSELAQIARTALSGNGDSEEFDRYAPIVGMVVDELTSAGEGAEVNLDNVKVLTVQQASKRLYRGVGVLRGPSPAHDSEWVYEDFDSELTFPEPVDGTTVAIIDDEIDFEKTATNLAGGSGSGLAIQSAESHQQYRDDLRALREGAAERVSDLGVDVLISKEQLDRPMRVALEIRDVDVIDKVQYPLSDVYSLGRATGATVISRIDELERDHLGVATRIVEQQSDEEVLTVFEGESQPTFSIVVEGQTVSARMYRKQIVESALEVTSVAAADRQILPGAGAAPMAVSMDLHNYASTVSDREQLAIDGFADGIEETVRVLAENAGHNHIDTISRLRSAHTEDECTPSPYGFDARSGAIVDAYEAGLVEPRRVLSYAIDVACTTAEQLLMTDLLFAPEIDLDTFTPATERD